MNASLATQTNICGHCLLEQLSLLHLGPKSPSGFEARKSLARGTRLPFSRRCGSLSVDSRCALRPPPSSSILHRRHSRRLSIARRSQLLEGCLPRVAAGARVKRERARTRPRFHFPAHAGALQARARALELGPHSDLHEVARGPDKGAGRSFARLARLTSAAHECETARWPAVSASLPSGRLRRPISGQSERFPANFRGKKSPRGRLRPNAEHVLRREMRREAPSVVASARNH